MGVDIGVRSGVELGSETRGDSLREGASALAPVTSTWQCERLWQ